LEQLNNMCENKICLSKDIIYIVVIALLLTLSLNRIEYRDSLKQEIKAITQAIQKQRNQSDKNIHEHNTLIDKVNRR